jgi:hypothetical protein
MNILEEEEFRFRNSIYYGYHSESVFRNLLQQRRPRLEQNCGASNKENIRIRRIITGAKAKEEERGGEDETKLKGLEGNDESTSHGANSSVTRVKYS